MLPGSGTNITVDLTQLVRAIIAFNKIVDDTREIEKKDPETAAKILNNNTVQRLSALIQELRESINP